MLETSATAESRTPVLFGQTFELQPFLSVLVAAQYRFHSNGKLTLLEAPAELASAVRSYPPPAVGPEIRTNAGSPRSESVQLLQRDIDLYSSRKHTDLILQAAVRTKRPVSSLNVKLEVGLKNPLRLELQVTGDRVVTGAKGGFKLSDAEPFSEMPLRYDRAYGGADAEGEHHLLSPERRAAVEKRLGQRLPRPFGTCAYPRNPAGRGYVLDEARLEGLAWPNVLFAATRWSPSSAVVHPLDWDLCPLPACFDWISPAWYPRSAWLMGLPLTRDRRLPQSERTLGVFEADPATLPFPQRTVLGLAQGSAPLLWRGRWRGDERVTLSHAGIDCGLLVVELPGKMPRIELEQPGPPGKSPGNRTRRKDALKPELDLVLIEADEQRLTLLWRGTGAPSVDNAPRGWETLCEGRAFF